MGRSILLAIMWVFVLGSPWVQAGEPGQAARSEAFLDEMAGQGRVVYRHYCVHCHGLHGDGDGFNADNLDTEPAELSSAKFIKKKKDNQLYRVIELGGKKVRKSNLMPSFGHTLSEQEIWSLIVYIRRGLARDKKHVFEFPPKMQEERPSPTLSSPEELKEFSREYADEGSREKITSAGEYLFYKKKSCFGCHSVDEEGGHVGPELTRAGFLYSPEWLYTWIKSPQRIRPDTKMPNLGLTHKEAKAIAFFVASLTGDFDEVPEDWEPYLESQGDSKRGETLFFDLKGKAACSRCHTVQGKGGEVGPNLSFIGSSRNAPFVLESVIDPGAVITVGFESLAILTQGGDFIKGIKKFEDDQILELVDKEGQHTKIPKDTIKKFKIEEGSVMPGNFKKTLSVQEIADLLAYLKTLQLPLAAKEK